MTRTTDFQTLASTPTPRSLLFKMNLLLKMDMLFIGVSWLMVILVTAASFMVYFNPSHNSYPLSAEQIASQIFFIIGFVMWGTLFLLLGPYYIKTTIYLQKILKVKIFNNGYEIAAMFLLSEVYFIIFYLRLRKIFLQKAEEWKDVMQYQDHLAASYPNVKNPVFFDRNQVINKGSVKKKENFGFDTSELGLFGVSTPQTILTRLKSSINADLFLAIISNICIVVTLIGSLLIYFDGSLADGTESVNFAFLLPGTFLTVLGAGYYFLSLILMGTKLIIFNKYILNHTNKSYVKNKKEIWGFYLAAFVYYCIFYNRMRKILRECEKDWYPQILQNEKTSDFSIYKDDSSISQTDLNGESDKKDTSSKLN